MPLNKEAYLRYRIIDECLRNKFHRFPSMTDIIDKCREKLGKTFSDATIQKDIKAMKEDEVLGYLAPIKFSRVHKGYFYADENFTIASIPLNDNDIEAIEFAASVLQQFRGVKLFDQFDFAVNKIFNAINIRSVLGEEESEEIIQIEKVPMFRGNEHLGLILGAIKNKKTITFDYQRFDLKVAKNHIVHPYLLREYKHRWYFVGMIEKNKRTAIFSLDRISNIEISEQTYYEKQRFNAGNYFKHAYGITTFEGEPEEVILSFSRQQGNYIKTQPIHETQTVLKDDENEFRICLRVGLTIELIMDILSFGPAVKVLSPKKLQNQIKSELEKNLSFYS